MLVIATPDPDSVAETFVRQHIRLLSPGETAVIYFEGEGDSIKDLPNLRIDLQSSATKWKSLKNLVIHGYAGTASGGQADRIVQFLDETGAQCVLAEFGQTACALKAACKRAAVPLYAFFHGQDASAAGRTFKNRYSYWSMARYASRVFSQTNYFAETVRRAGVPSGKIAVAPSGLDIADFSPAAAKDPNLVLAVGRMVEKKAPHLTVRAFAGAAKAVVGTRLEMIGDGPLREKAAAAARSLGIESRVIFHGARDHDFVKRKISEAALFVQHSVTAPNGDTESLGITLLEAMASEVPVIATRHNGFVETVEDGVGGYLVDEGDVQGMTERMIELLNNRQKSEAMGQAGRKRVEAHFDSKRQSAQLRRLLGLSNP